MDSVRKEPYGQSQRQGWGKAGQPSAGGADTWWAAGG